MNIILTLIKKSSEIKPKDISQCDKNQNIHKTFREIVKFYENHAITLLIKKSVHLYFMQRKNFVFIL